MYAIAFKPVSYDTRKYPIHKRQEFILYTIIINIGQTPLAELQTKPDIFCFLAYSTASIIRDRARLNNHSSGFCPLSVLLPRHPNSPTGTSGLSRCRKYRSMSRYLTAPGSRSDPFYSLGLTLEMLVSEISGWHLCADYNILAKAGFLKPFSDNLFASPLVREPSRHRHGLCL